MLKNLRDFGFKTDNKFYVIAEVGINHGGDMDKAKRLIDSASSTGVDAIKFQTYITEKRVEQTSPIFDVLKECELPLEKFEILKRHTEQYGIEFMSTPFDKESVECLDDLGVEIYKIASFDVNNHNLLRQIANTGKTAIMSVGMSNLDEIKNAYDILREKSDKQAILHCISAYPTKVKDANISAIYRLKNDFDCVIGQSDHTPGTNVPIVAAAAGAQVLEKHYMIHEDFKCVDSPVSITEFQLRYLVQSLRELEGILGEGDFGVRPAEKGATIFRRISGQK